MVACTPLQSRAAVVGSSLQATASASSLEEIIAAHDHFLADASGTTFTAPQQPSELLHHANRRLLSLVWEFATTARSATAQVSPSLSRCILQRASHPLFLLHELSLAA